MTNLAADDTRTPAKRLAVLRERHRGLAYAMAVALITMAALAQLSLNPSSAEQLRFFTFYPAIVLAAYLGGLGPGLLATGLSTVVATVWSPWPMPSLLAGVLANHVALALFLGLGAAISVLMESLHRATAAHARAEATMARSAERLRILREIDQATIAGEAPEAIAETVIRPLRALLGVPRIAVSLFDLAAGTAEWLVAAGRRRVHVGPGVRYPMHLMGDVEALRRGALQVVDVLALPSSPEVDALLASGVEEYMVVPMIAADELIGALTLGGGKGVFSSEQVGIAQEAAAQLAIGIAQARLNARVKREAEDLEQRVRERTADLQATQEHLVRSERLALMRLLAGGVSHELRKPLGAIANAIAYLNAIAPDDARIRKHLGILQREAARATRITSGMLDFARGTPPRPAAIDLNAAVREMLDDLPVPQGVAVTLNLAEDLPPTVADVDHVGLIIANILSNAIEAMPRGGQLTIETGRHGSELWLAIADTGRGIDPAHAAKIFDPLFTTKPSGMSLGLAIAKCLADRNAVRIAVEAAPGQSTRFALTFGFPGADAESAVPTS